MKTNINKILISALSAILVVGISACSASTAPATDVPVPAETAPSIDSGNENGNGTTMLDIAESELTQEEIEALLFMREEEKLARDVYLYMYEKWGAEIFANISESEQRHMDAVARLITRYGIEDPVVDDVEGVFTNEAISALYVDLTAQGAASLEAALQVGVDIEKLDIADLEDALAEVEMRAITRVFNNLLDGSENHLAAFLNAQDTGIVDCPAGTCQCDCDGCMTRRGGQGSGNNGNGDGVCLR